jgi:thiosulfate reductase/polysulfide reductase chain A
MAVPSEGSLVKKTYCQFCSNLCGVLVRVEDGRVVDVRGNPDHPLTRGFTCERVRIAPKWLYHPGQLKYPLKRAGGRGEGKWHRITWDEAMGEIGQKLLSLKREEGPETLGVFEGTFRGNEYWPRARFLSLFGNPHNIFAPGIICGINDMAINMAVMGDVTTYGVDSSNSKCVVYWGCDPSESNMRGWAGILRTRKKRDIKVIVVDPRQTKTSDIADVWLRLRPGTDTALALAWLNVIINEELYNRDFVQQWTVGFERLKQRVQEYDPQRVAAITGVPADLIVEAARLYATNRPACMPYGVAIDQLGLNGTRTEQCKIIMRAITGNLGIPGGHLISQGTRSTEAGSSLRQSCP